MLFFVISLSMLVAYTIYEIHSRLKAFALRDAIGLGGPPVDFFSGNLRLLLAYAKKNGLASTPQYPLELRKHYGRTVGFYIGKRLLVVTSDRELVRELFVTKFSQFSNRLYITLNGMYPFGESLLQVGVEGGTHAVGWKEIRSVVTAIFTSAKMKKMHHLFHDQIESFLDCLNERSKEAGGSMDIYGEYQALTMDVIARCAFGLSNVSCIRDRDNAFYTRARFFFANLNFDNLFLVLASVFTPLGVFRRFSNWGRAERKLVDDLSVVVQQREEERASGKIRESPDLIDLILQENEKRVDTGDRPIHHDVIVSNCYAFLLAGYETTSTALSYASFLLADHPDCQEHLYEEVMETFGSDGDVDYDRVMKMPYLNAVMLESLRLKPPLIAFTARECICEGATVGEYKIPKGVAVLTPVNTIHYDEEYWSEPQSFLPERFLDEKLSNNNYAYMPFGLGPRNCVGARFAEMEFKTVLASVIRKFRFEVDPAEPKLRTLISSVLQLPVKGRVILRVQSR